MSDAHGVARDQLRAFIGRIERLEEEKKTIAEDIKGVYGEAKSMGFDAKILRKVISIRKQDADERAEQEAILDTYLHALGMIQLDIFEEPEERVDPTTGEILDRMQAKSRARMTDGMADHKALSAALAKEGLISEEAHAENVVLADKLAEKFGNGRSDGGLNIVTKHTEIATASQGGTASPSSDAELSSAGANAGGEDVDRSAERADINAVASASGPDEKRASHSPAKATEMDRDVLRGDEIAHAVPAENARKAVPETEDGSVSHAGAGESPATNFIGKPKYVLRPHCLNPRETCGGYSDKHCHACTVAMRKREQAEEFA
ncbi:DUF2312 domain-containing protein [Sinorhizobium meliloti]|uniref:DUF2312 domain-containing protein n=2 Tax=Rhizobium meliloti TaxID=382 RepID=UPI000FDB8C0B|nr:DUF2312 domain-containing protein [Sinorhizobium meliloti]RVM29303.1 DUF2312 domain-containing protein [Sinorhizobium meliloti]RVO09047.1 DUF2312 domain-containing protein [Sinorhizobium meliloti]